MGRHTIQLNTPNRRLEAHALVDRAPETAFVTFTRNKRTIPQNSKLWALLSRIATAVEWHGRKWDAYAWKDFFCDMLSDHEYMPGATGTPVRLSRSTSSMDKATCADLITLIVAFADRYGIDLGEPTEGDTAPTVHPTTGDTPERTAA